MPAPFRIYNTLSRKVEPFEPLEAGKVRLYVCGMTVYADAHLGHARAMVVFDTFVRYLRYRGWAVTFVRNFTDVDDKIIHRANEAGEDPAALAQRFVDDFHRDMASLGLLVPDHEPRVTTSMDAILAMIGQLVAQDNAYASDGNVWFSVPSCKEYGRLSGQSVQDVNSEDPGTGKHHPADFALWKAVKPGEPSWDSPWGPGRPGWHIECSAMAKTTLGDTVDIHGGGLDLVFPHHENEIAQSECAHHAPFSRVWMHNGLLTVRDETGREGGKMGKSLGNSVSIHRLVQELPAEALRLYYLQVHYRSPLPYVIESEGRTAERKAQGEPPADDQTLSDALGMLGRLYEAREVAERMGGEEPADRVIQSLGTDAQRVYDLGKGFAARLHEALDDDFNTSQGLAHAFDLARAINRLSNNKQALRRAASVVAPALAGLALLPDALGLMCLTSAAFQDEIKQKRLPKIGLTAVAVDGLVAERAAARAAKDWARADALRADLEGRGIAVMDRADGSDWRVRLTISAESP